MYRYEKPINWIGVRIAAVAAVFALVTVLLLIRAYRLQIIDAERLKALAEKQRTESVKLNGRRGAILDRSGEFLAASPDVKSIYARPRQISNVKGAAKALAEVLEDDEEEMLKKLQTNKPFVWIERKASPHAAERVMEANIEGVGTDKEYNRVYPLKSLAAHAIGFASIDSEGLEGLELYYDRDLKNLSVPATAPRDARGRPVMFTGWTRTPSRRDLHLTLDHKIQYVVERALEKAVTKHRAKAGMAVVLDADSGEILAMAVNPTYNLNVFHKVPADVRRNRLVADTFEPGSTFKVFLAAAAMDLGRVSPNDGFYCHRGKLKYKGSEIHDIVPRRTLSFENVIAYSSNIGAVKISDKLRKSEFYGYLKGFGFGSRTDVDLPGERSGTLAPPGRWSAITKANIAFGQGIATNALQLTTAFAAAINGGTLYKPHLMKRITNALGETIREQCPVEVRRVVKPHVSKGLVKILRKVVVKGTGKAAAIDGVYVIGKTGTAQKADPTGGYSRDRYVASFIGALMSINPRPVIFVMLDEPSGKFKTGGKIAAPVFHEIAEGILALCGGRSCDPEILQASGPPRSRLQARKPPRRAVPRKGQNEREWIVPDLRGLTMRQVVEVCGKMKCDAEFSGVGKAVDQAPSPGSVFKEGSALKVSFKEGAS